MAEVVQRNLELMLPELEELERSGIFSPEEIKEIVRRRRNMEYKLQRRPVRLEDFLRAITYELNLDRLRKARKKRLGVTSTRRDAEFGIQDRVHSLFKRAVKRFKDDIRLWLQYIDFCQKSRHHISLGKVLAKALALHPTKPGLWVMAAKFQFEEQHDPSSGRSTMQQGLRSNPSSTHLWLEYFRLELMHVGKMRKRQQMLGLEKSKDEEIAKLGEDFFSYHIPSIVFHEAIKAVPDNLKFHVSFLDIYRLFEDTEEKQEEVYASMKSRYSQHALCWETLARRHCLYTAHTTESELVLVEDQTEKCYKEGLRVVGEPGLLWSHYIQWCRERVEASYTTDTIRQRAIKRLLTAYAHCTEAGHMSEHLIKEQVRVLSGLGLFESAHEALVAGTNTHPHSATLWLLRVKSEGCGGEGGKWGGGEESLERLSQLCSEATGKIPKQNSLCVWQYWLERLISHDRPHPEVETVFQSAIAKGSETAKLTLSLQYIDWALAVGGVKSARKVYKKLLDRGSVLYTLHCKCIDVEKSVEKPSMKRLRDLYEKALSEWGADHPDLWLDYISTETRIPGGDAGKVSLLHWRAMKTLTGTHTADFVAKYSMLQLTT